MDPVVVIGGGLSGLACGFELVRAGVPVRVVEARARAGGVVGTERVRGYLFEDGPNTVPGSALELRRLAHELGLGPRMVESLPEARDRFLYIGGRLRALPRGPLGLVTTPLLSLRAKLRLASEPLRRHRAAPHGAREPDLGTFLAERIGDEAARTLAGAFVRGVYAAELDELGAMSAFPRLWAMAQQHGGLARGMLARRKVVGSERDAPGPALRRGALVSFEDGFGELIDALVRSLGGALALGNAATRIERSGEGFTVLLADGERLRAAGVVLALPARTAAALLEPLTDAAAVAPLVRLRHASVTLVHLGFAPGADGAQLLPAGFGYLVPPGGPAVTGERAPRVLGTIFTSNLFAGRAPAGAAATTSFYRTGDIERELGGSERELGGLERQLGGDGRELGQARERALVQLATDDLARALGRGVPKPTLARVKAWRDVIPSYGPGHADALAALEATLAERVPGLVLAGNFVGGISVEQVIARGRSTARALAARYDHRPDSRPAGPSREERPAHGAPAQP